MSQRVTLLTHPDEEGKHYRTTKEQRQHIREAAGILVDGLFKRDGEDPEVKFYSALWCGPIGWWVSYGCNADGKTLWGRIYSGPTKSDGGTFEQAKLYESTDEDFGERWLDIKLP